MQGYNSSLMLVAEAVVMLLVLVPSAGALACLLVGRRRLSAPIVAMVAVVIAVASMALFIEVASNGFDPLLLQMSEWTGRSVEVLGFLMSLTFLYLGGRTRSILVIAFSLGQLLVLGSMALSPVSMAVPLLIDTLALIMVLITSLVGSLIAIYSVTYMRDDPRRGTFLAIILVFLGVMNAAVMCNDVRWFEAFWGVTTLLSFLLIGHTRTNEARGAARLALLMNTGGGLALLVGAWLMQHYHGTYMLSDLSVGGATGLALLPVAMMSIGAFTKSAQLPFQSWLLGAMVAPTPVSALLHSSTMVNLGAFLVLRVAPSFQGEPALSAAVALVGGISFLLTSILAMSQGNAKRLLAYSTIGNLGLIFMCAGIGTPLALAAAVVLLLYHAVSKALLFLAVGVVNEDRASEDIEDMYGLRGEMPLVTLSIFIGVATLVLPPFGMFVSKWLISEATVTFPFLAFLLAIGFASIVVYYFKWLGILLTSFRGPKRPLREDASPRTYRWVLGSLSAGAVALSALIGPVTNHLVAPLVASEFHLPGLTGSISLFTEEGGVQALLVLFLVTMAIAAMGIFRRKGGRMTVPYGGGEVVTFQVGGEYYLSDERVSRITDLGNTIAIVILVSMVVAPLVLEVI